MLSIVKNTKKIVKYLNKVAEIDPATIQNLMVEERDCNNELLESRFFTRRYLQGEEKIGRIAPLTILFDIIIKNTKDYENLQIVIDGKDVTFELVEKDSKE